jgi:GntR family transcriptional regulator/MocR family aminotransferase
MARHVRRMRRVYAGRRAVMLDLLEAWFAPWLVPVPSSAGLHVTALARDGLDGVALASQARRIGVVVQPLRPYVVGPPARDGLVLGFGALDEDGIREGLRRLRTLLPAST